MFTCGDQEWAAGELGSRSTNSGGIAVATHTARPGGVIPAARPPRKQPAVGPAPAAASQVPDLRSCTLHSWESCTARWGAGNAISEAEHGVGSSAPPAAAAPRPPAETPCRRRVQDGAHLASQQPLAACKGRGGALGAGSGRHSRVKGWRQTGGKLHGTPRSTPTRCDLTEGGWAQDAAERHKEQQCEMPGCHGVP